MQLWMERPHITPRLYSLPDWIDTGGSVACACTTLSACHICVSNSSVTAFLNPKPCAHAGGDGALRRTMGQFYSAPGWMLNLYLMYDISHKSSDHRHDPGVFRRLLFQCLSNCGIIRPRESEGREGGKAFEFGEMITLSLLRLSHTVLLSLCDIMIAELRQIENILAVWRLYEITIYYV